MCTFGHNFFFFPEYYVPNKSKLFRANFTAQNGILLTLSVVSILFFFVIVQEFYPCLLL
jgi:hypothetical protein